MSEYSDVLTESCSALGGLLCCLLPSVDAGVCAFSLPWLVSASVRTASELVALSVMFFSPWLVSLHIFISSILWVNLLLSL